MDNLKELRDSIDNVVPINGGIASVKTINDNPSRKIAIEKLGRYTGFPFISGRTASAPITAGQLFWNNNAMNKTTPYDITLSKFTADGNDIERILLICSKGSLIHFKDFVGRSTTLEFIGYTIEDNIITLNVKGFEENTDYNYQIGEFEPCIVEFINKVNSQNNKIVEIVLGSDFEGTLLEQLVLVINDTNGFEVLEDEIFLFKISDNGTKKAQFVFKNGKGLWGQDGTLVTIVDFVEIFSNGIPLSGTEENNEVKGSVEFTEIEKTLWIKGVDYPDEFHSIEFTTGGILLKYRSNIFGVDTTLQARSNGIEINSNAEDSQGIYSIYDHTQNLDTFAYIQKKYHDDRGLVEDSTTVVLSELDLNTSYPSAKEGFRVLAQNITGGGVLYQKGSTNWFSQNITTVT